MPPPDASSHPCHAATGKVPLTAPPSQALLDMVAAKANAKVQENAPCYLVELERSKAEELYGRPVGSKSVALRLLNISKISPPKKDACGSKNHGGKVPPKLTEMLIVGVRHTFGPCRPGRDLR